MLAQILLEVVVAAEAFEKYDIDMLFGVGRVDAGEEPGGLLFHGGVQG